MSTHARQYEIRNLQALNKAIEGKKRLHVRLPLPWEIERGITYINILVWDKRGEEEVILPRRHDYLASMVEYMAGLTEEPVPLIRDEAYESGLIRDFRADCEMQLASLFKVWPTVRPGNVQKNIGPGETYFFKFHLPKGLLTLILKHRFMTQEEVEKLYDLVGTNEEEININYYSLFNYGNIQH